MVSIGDGVLREQIEKCQFLADTVPDEDRATRFQEMADMLRVRLKQLLERGSRD